LSGELGLTGGAATILRVNDAKEPTTDTADRSSVVPNDFAGLSLIMLRDPEARVRFDRGLLGRDMRRRMWSSAAAAGFSRLIITSSVDAQIEGARTMAPGAALRGPGLVVYEGTVMARSLLEQMAAHPLPEGESFSVDDGIGRPAAWFAGDVGQVPALLPLAELLELPRDHHADDVVRMVRMKDLARAERLVLREEGITGRDCSAWEDLVERRILRWLARGQVHVARFELAAVGIVLASGPLALLQHWGGLVLASVALFVGVECARLVAPLARLAPQESLTTRRRVGGHLAPGQMLTRAIRPIGHAVLAAGLTYWLVATQTRSPVASVVVLAAGVVGATLPLLWTRSLLRGAPRAALELPKAVHLLQRLDLRLPSWLEGVPLLELLIVLCACSTSPELPWLMLVAGAVARLWRWFVEPAEQSVRHASSPPEQFVPPPVENATDRAGETSGSSGPSSDDSVDSLP
jgi:hypothetical protein